MTDVDVITVFCEGPPGASHPRRVLCEYERITGLDPPQWWQRPAAAALAMDNAPGVFAPATWPLMRKRFTLRCRDCRLHVKRTLDRAYEEDYPPITTVFETMRANGIGQISGRGLEGVVAWTRSPV